MRSPKSGWEHMIKVDGGDGVQKEIENQPAEHLVERESSKVVKW